MKKIILGTILIIFLLTVTACSSEEEQEIPTTPIEDDEQQTEPTDTEPPQDSDSEINQIQDVNIIYEEGIVTYEVIVSKPTPCHELINEARIIEGNILEITINMQSTAEMCSQVITPDVVYGELEADIEPIDYAIIMQ